MIHVVSKLIIFFKISFKLFFNIFIDLKNVIDLLIISKEKLILFLLKSKFRKYEVILTYYHFLKKNLHENYV